MTRSNEILCRPQGHSWNSPHSHDGDLSGALYLSCPGEPCVITLLDPRVAAVSAPEELLGSGTIAFNRAQGVGDVVQQLEEGEVLIFPTWVEHHVPPLPKPR